MATLEEIVVLLTAETSQLKAELKTATDVTKQSTEKMEKAIKEFSENSAKNTSFLQSSMATLTGFLGSQAVLGTVEIVKDAFREMGVIIGEGVQDANKQEEAMKRLATSLALSGQYSQKAVEGFEEFINAMEKQTGVADDVVASNLAILSSITRLDSQGLKEAQKAALDFSSALGIDLETATRLVAKGIEGNVSAFQRYGIQIQEGRNQTENFANVVGELNNRFGGAAKGNLQTFAGGILNLQNSFGNAVEAIGRVITNNEALKAVITELSKIFADLEKYVELNADTLSKGFSAAIESTLIGIAAALNLIGQLVESFKLTYSGIMVAVEGLVAFGKAYMFISDLEFDKVGSAFDGVGKRIDDVNNILSGKTTNAFFQVQEKLIGITTEATKAGDAQTKAFSNSTPAVKNQSAAIDELVTKFYNYRQAVIDSENAVIKGYLDSAAAFNSTKTLQLETLETQYQADLVSFNDYQAQKLEILQQSQQAEMALLDQYRANGTVSEQQYQLALAQMSAKQANDTLKTQTELNKQRSENMKSTLGTIATLSSSSSKELAAIGKAAAISTATIDGYAAVQKALASAPPPFNFALAAAVGVATAANIAKIAGVGLAKGIDEVPGIGTQDNFPAVLAPGERVVPAKSNEDLTEFLQSQNDEKSRQPIVINMNFTGIGAISREQASDIVSAINDALAANASLRILT
jgi:hypothetical protein